MRFLSSAILGGLALLGGGVVAVTHPDAEDLARAELPAPAVQPVMQPVRTSIVTPVRMAIADGGVMHPAPHCPAPDRGFNPLYTKAAHRHAAGTPHTTGCAVHSLAEVESNQNPEAESHAGAKGLMQVVDATADEWGVDPWIPEQAVEFAIRYLVWLADRFPHVEPADLPRFILAAYNRGVGFVRRTGCRTWACLEPLLPRETVEYVYRNEQMVRDGTWYRHTS